MGSTRVMATAKILTPNLLARFALKFAPTGVICYRMYGRHTSGESMPVDLNNAIFAVVFTVVADG